MQNRIIYKKIRMLLEFGNQKNPDELRKSGYFEKNPDDLKLKYLRKSGKFEHSDIRIV